MTELERLDALIAQQEKSIRDAFRLFIATLVREGPVLTAILERLEARDTDGALKIVDSYIASFANVLPSIMHTVGAATAIELTALVPHTALAVSFDPSNPRAAEVIRANRLEFARGFTDQQRAATLQALARAQREGMGTAETARLFRGSIGLTAQQETHVQSYRAALESQSRQALDRALRDQRFDARVERAIETGRPLTGRQVDMMVERYRGRYRQMRSETIARTEGVRATSQAREESVGQMIDQLGIASDRIERIWNATRDHRVRDWHASMSGQKRGRNEAFVDGLGNRLMYPGDPRAAAETVINCRCVLTFSIKDAA